MGLSVLQWLHWSAGGKIRALLLMVAIVLIAGNSWAEERYSASELVALRFEELVNVTISSLSKKDEKYLATAGAVFVITDDDIRRAGVRNIPDALRLAPGLQVSQTNMNQYQIGIRGQADFWTDLLLVMIDGRPIYNTTFSGVWWVSQNYPLEEIERIEIIRGPGGSIWGSNATNGIINIITKQAGDTLGTRLTAGAGNEEKGFTSLRYGNQVGNLNYRLYGMGENRHGGLANTNNAVIPFGQETPDFRRFNQEGFRMDWDKSESTKLSLHGDLYRMRAGQIGHWVPAIVPGQAHVQFADVNKLDGQNLVFRLEKGLSSGTLLKAQMFYDRYHVLTKILNEKKRTLDAEFQVDFSRLLGQNISIGSNVRNVESRYANTPQLQMPDRTTKLTSFFINDEIPLFHDHLRLIGGIKMERNSYTTWEYQPSVRAIYTDARWALWAAASKAVRTPNDMESGGRWNVKTTGGLPFLLRVVGDGSVVTEKVETYEAGIRLRPSDESLIEVTVFKTFYDNVPDTHASAANFFVENGIVVVPVNLINMLNGKGDGVEANFRYQPRQWLTLKGSYTYLHQVYDDWPIKDAESRSTVTSTKGQDPANRFHVGVSLDPSSQLEFDFNLYFTGPFRQGSINGHHRLDARIGWKPTENLEFSLAGQDLLRYSHRENTDNSMEYSTMIQQRYYLSMTYRR